MGGRCPTSDRRIETRTQSTGDSSDSQHSARLQGSNIVRMGARSIGCDGLVVCTSRWTTQVLPSAFQGRRRIQPAWYGDLLWTLFCPLEIYLCPLEMYLSILPSVFVFFLWFHVYFLSTIYSNGLLLTYRNHFNHISVTLPAIFPTPTVLHNQIIMYLFLVLYFHVNRHIPLNILI